jgi:hypothetical protein
MDPIMLGPGVARIVGTPKSGPQCFVAQPLEQRGAEGRAARRSEGSAGLQTCSDRSAQRSVTALPSSYSAEMLSVLGLHRVLSR